MKGVGISGILERCKTRASVVKVTSYRSVGTIRSARIPLHPILRVVFVVCFALMLWELISEVADGMGRLPVWLLLAPATALVGAVAFSYQRIEVTPSEVVFISFPFYRRRVPLDEIAAVRVVPVDELKFAGWGLVLHTEGGVTLTNRRGDGVSIASTSGITTTISVEEPEMYVRALTARGVPTT